MALPPIFDDDALAGELLQPRQRLDKHFRLLIGAQIGVHVEMEPRSLQFCRQFFSFLRSPATSIAAGCYKQPTGLFVSFRSRR